MKRLLLLPGAFLCLTAGMCSTPQPGIDVHTIEVVKEVQVPCPVEQPKRPATVAPSGIPAQAQDAVRYLFAALLEWQGPGKYGDQAEAVIETCARPSG